MLRWRASVALGRTAVLLRRRRLLLWVRRVPRRSALPTLLRVGRVRRRRLAALLRVRRVRRLRRTTVALRRPPLRRPLRHELVALLARRRLALAGRRVALLLRRVAVSRVGWRVAIALRRRTVPLRRAVTVTRPGRPARREHRAARPAPRRRPRRREDDFTSSLIRSKRTKPRRHGRLGLLVLGEGHKPKASWFARVLVPHHDDLAQRAEGRKRYFQILLRVVLSQIRHI